MKKLIIILLTILSLTVYATEVPNQPNGRTSLSISMFGTNENPANPPYFRFFVYEMQNDALLSSLSSKGEESKKNSDIKKRITKDEYSRIYKAFNVFFDNYKLSEERNLIEDGSSIEIKLSVGSNSTSITLANNSFVKSEELKSLLESLEKIQPGCTQFLLQVFDKK